MLPRSFRANHSPSGRGSEWFGGELPYVFDWMNRKKRAKAVPELGRHGLDSNSEDFRCMRPSDNRFYWLTGEELNDRYTNDSRTWRNSTGAATLQARLKDNDVHIYARGFKRVLLAGHAHHASVHSAADLVTRAGGALVIQAGTATSIRVREQNQSFNVIDIEDGDVTLTVECWCETHFEPKDAQKYEYHDGKWRILPAEEPAH